MLEQIPKLIIKYTTAIINKIFPVFFLFLAKNGIEIRLNNIDGPNITKKIIKNNPSKLTSKNIITQLLFGLTFLPYHLYKVNSSFQME